MKQSVLLITTSIACIASASAFGNPFASKAVSPIEQAMKQNFGKPTLGNKCDSAYGKINWSGVQGMMTDPAAKQVVETHINTNIIPCMADGSNKNLLATIKSSCDVIGAPSFELKDSICTKANELLGGNAQQKFEDSLLPGLTDIGCSRPVADKLNIKGLAEYKIKLQGILSNPQVPIPEKQKAMGTGQKIENYVAQLQKCVTSAGDKNFNAALQAKFSDTQNCALPQELVTLAQNPVAKDFLLKIYGDNGLCKTASATGTVIDNNAQVEQAKKTLGVPSTPLGYVGFPESLVTPLAGEKAADALATWAQHDQPGFSAHFGKIAAGLKGADGKVVNPKAANILATACGSTLAQVQVPQIQEICAVAVSTHSANTALMEKQKNFMQAVNTLGIPSGPQAFVMYKTCPANLASKLNPDAAQVIADGNPKLLANHFQGVSNCLDVKHPEFTQTVANGCGSGLNTSPLFTDVCTKAKATSEEMQASMQQAAGLQPTSSDALTTGLLDQNAAIDNSTLTTADTMVAPNLNTTNATSNGSFTAAPDLTATPSNNSFTTQPAPLTPGEQDLNGFVDPTKPAAPASIMPDGMQPEFQHQIMAAANTN